MKISYGIEKNNIDVTEICYNQLLNNNIITIPSCDHTRATYFPDIVWGFVKKIFITLKDSDSNILEYDDNKIIKINILNNSIEAIDDIDLILSKIHKKLKINHGNFYELYGIAAAVLGGCSLRGGDGSIIGIVIGTALLLVLQNLVNLLGIPGSLNFAVMGAVVLIGVVADQLFQKRSAKKLAQASASK